MRQLGGETLFVTDKEIGMGTRESVHDVAKVMSRFCDGIMIRWFDHQEVVDLARYASVPVINGLTDFAHPCQALADFMTLLEHMGDVRGKRLCCHCTACNN